MAASPASVRLVNCRARPDVEGEYALNDSFRAYLEHDRPVYETTGEGEKSFVYFWEDAEDKSVSGWYIAGEVGSEDVVGFNAQRLPTPPQQGWRIKAAGSEELQDDPCGFQPAASVAQPSAANAEMGEKPPTEEAKQVEAPEEVPEATSEESKEKLATSEVPMEDRDVEGTPPAGETTPAATPEAPSTESEDKSAVAEEVPTVDAVPAPAVAAAQEETPPTDAPAGETVPVVKKPVGGAFGIFLSERRADFAKEAAAAGGKKGVGPIAKLASAAWKALPEDERAAFEAKFGAAMAEYKKYAAAQPSPAPGKKRASAASAAESTAKRARGPSSAEASSVATPQKRGRPAAVAGTKPSPPKRGKAAAAGPPACSLDKSVLAKAEEAGLRGVLEKLAADPQIAERNLPGVELLAQLQKNEGLLHKTRRVIVGA